MERLRITHVCQPADGGAAGTAAVLARTGVENGHVVTVAGPSGSDLSNMVHASGAAWVRLPLRRQPTVGDLRALLSVRRLALQTDVLHLHSSKAGAVGRLAVATIRPRRRPRVVFTPHGWSWYVGGRAAGAYRIFERIAARWADAIVVVSEGEACDGRAVLGRYAKRMRLIYNGVDVARFTPKAGAGDDTPPFMLVVGRLSEQKGQDIAVRAFARARSRDVRLRLVGEGPARAGLEHLVDQLGVADSVDFVGKSDALDHLRACRLVVAPSRWEGFSLLVLEAMATGCAVIATKRGGEEALGPTGWIVPDGEPVGQIATAIDTLLADPGRRAALGEAARGRVLERFTLDRCLRDHLALWASLRAET